MINIRQIICRVLQDDTGAMMIETAFIAPILLTLAIGGFEVSTMVSRQTEMQSAVAEAAAIVRASPPGTTAERTTIRDILKTSTGLNSFQVWVFPIYRCGAAESYTADQNTCGATDTVSEYIRVVMFDVYQPMWTEFGIGGPVLYNVNRTIQVG